MKRAATAAAAAAELIPEIGFHGMCKHETKKKFNWQKKAWNRTSVYELCKEKVLASTECGSHVSLPVKFLELLLRRNTMWTKHFIHIPIPNK